MHQALTAGCCDFIAKPILDYARLCRKIRTLLGLESAPVGAHQFQAA
jgi:hypothetical protein